jgi:hypothetical protein
MSVEAGANHYEPGVTAQPPATLSSLTDDWSGWGASPYVCLVEKLVPKTPENVVTDDGTLWVSGARLINAFRLVGEGDISIGPMWITRKSVFRIGAGGVARVGWSIPAPTIGAPYRVTRTLGARAAEVFASLAALDEI